MASASYYADCSAPPASQHTQPCGLTPYSVAYGDCNTSYQPPTPSPPTQQAPSFPPPPGQTSSWQPTLQPQSISWQGCRPPTQGSSYLASPVPDTANYFTPHASPQPRYSSLPPPPPSWPSVGPPTPAYTPGPPTLGFSDNIPRGPTLSDSYGAPLSTNATGGCLPAPTYSNKPLSQRPEPLIECPSAKGPDGVSFATYWYRIKGTTEFAICTRCYEDKLANTPFIDWFESWYYEPPPRGQMTCDFNTERVNQLLSQAVQTGNMNQLYNYAQRREQMGPCPGTQGIAGGNGVQWFGIADIAEFAVCATCFEEFVATSSFAQHFRPHSRVHTSDETWSCDLANHFLRRTFISSSKQNDWTTFTGWTRHYINLPSCPGAEQVHANSHNWYKPTGMDGMRICETCYLDYAGNLPIKDSFQLVQQKWHQAPTVSCAFSQLSVQIASSQLIEKDFNRWFQILSRLTTALPCGDIQDGTFYTLDNPYTAEGTGFTICERCYLGYCVSTNHEARFAKVTVPGVCRCDFHPTAPRFTKYLQKYTEMVFKSNPDILVDYICKMQQVQACPGSETFEVRQWWGTELCNFCAECYEEVGKDSFFEKGFRYRGNLLRDQKCDMHSENMRRRYWEACQKKDLMEFNEYCKIRMVIWQELQAAREDVDALATSDAAAQQVNTQPDVQQRSAQMAAQFQMRMGMMNTVFAINGEYNAAINGIMNSGSSYNPSYDPTYQSYQNQYTNAQSTLTQGMVAHSQANQMGQQQQTQLDPQMAALSAAEEKWKEVE
ncbi:hypothetical protein H2198_005915 [Neophaeococcomyces mojaviensis]|uniref:Uncharacterized protein n=1 Tax=Neophaeococcomyces mojaviensis TaxID=3383035 RepID=A0ACC3A4R6_9EURO|nr:hypothetical protein H2198_005915 [Knufia sp. JES_112]